MNHSARRPEIAAVLAVMLGLSPIACSGNDPGADSPGADGCDIKAIMAKPENGCTNSGCHGSNFQGGLDLLSPGVEQRLVGVPSTTDSCRGQLLVDPATPENSLILRQISPALHAKAPNACGVLMPFGTTTGVKSADLACFEGWVKHIAATVTPPSTDMPPPFDPSPVESYTNKVKTLVNGGVVTDDELKAVRANPAALRSLLTQWVESPGFQDKVMDFLLTDLQQSVGPRSLEPMLGTIRGPREKDIYNAVEQAFVRTAWDIIDGGRPFTQILTTRHWAMNSALLVALSFADYNPTELKNEKHTFFQSPPSGVTPPASLADSVARHVWEIPSLPAGCSGTLNGRDVMAMLSGFVKCGNYYTRFDDTVLAPSDFTDWRMVDIQTGAPPKFYDLPTLRGLQRVSLRQPRMGFFTSPAFLSGVATNEDNLFRVTTNQSLVVAIGQIFSPGDPTKPVRLDGLDKAHAGPETTCFGCHQFLDPMRYYFANAFSVDYGPHTGTTTVSPSFAFHGVTHDGGTLNDFAATLAGHPLFASAWVQKLCYYANSQACDENDPEFKRIVAAFVSSNYNFKQLVVELFSSPIVTGQQITETYKTEEFIVSIARQEHLCQMLDARLGTTGLCDQAGLFANLIPRDLFSRGSAVPVQPAETGLFHFAAADKLCQRLSNILVGTSESSRFNAQNAQASLDSLVEDLMGLSPSHPRHDVARQHLGTHYNEAMQANVGPVVALKSAFTLACLSPDVMALGL